MSTHCVEVIRVENVYKHPNADKLDIVKIYDYECAVGKGQFKVGDLAVYIEPDYVIDTIRQPLFNSEFLRGKAKNDGTLRIRAMKLRDRISYGLLVSAPEGSVAGDNVMEALGIIRYEPPAPKSLKGGGSGYSGESGVGPDCKAPEYDLEAYLKFNKVCFGTEETKDNPDLWHGDVIVTPKAHGQNSRHCWLDGKLYCGSRTTWKRDPGRYENNWKDPETGETTFRDVKESNWHMAARCNPWLEEWCKNNPGSVVYSEIVGALSQGQHFMYNVPPDQMGMFVFDVLENGKFVDNITLHTDPKYAGLQKVPVLYVGKNDVELFKAMAEEDETINGLAPGHVREGVVIKPTHEFYSHKVGRVALKLVSARYFNF